MSETASPMRVLGEIGVSAVLGTDRAGRSPTAAGELLSRAAVAQARARAGRAPVAGAAPVTPCPEDARPTAMANQAAFLERSLVDREFNVIDEWCGRANARGVRVPPSLVPALLDWWAAQSRRSPAVMHATGACGVWLASLNPRWHKPTEGETIPEKLDELWQTEAANERFALLRTVVQSDPDRALALIRSTWESDGADERRRFVETLARNVSPHYEAFLEGALDDRSKSVRREAARVLAMIPGSTLRARMNQRASEMIKVERSKTMLRREKVSITIEPPKEFDAAWERDALEEKAGGSIGKRAHWMRQIMSAADVSLWTTLTGLEPAAIIEAIQGDDYWTNAYHAMLESLATCPTQADTMRWCEALVGIASQGKIPDYTPMARVWRALSLEQSEGLRLAYMRAVPQHVNGVMWLVAVADDRPWTAAFSKQALEQLRGATPKQKESSDLWSQIDDVAHRLDPSAVELFEQIITQLYPDNLTPKIQQCLDLARARAEMHKEFNA